MAQFNFKAIGTTWVIDIYQKLDSDKESVILKKIMDRIGEFDRAYSRFRSDSVVGQISKKAGEYNLPSDSERLFFVYHNLYKQTGGYFTPLVGQLLVDAGYDANYSLKQKRELTIPPKWEDVMKYKLNTLSVKKPVQLDFGAAGKGYLIDLVADVLKENGYKHHCIDAGGDILHSNKELIRVGLEDPENANQVIGVYELGNGSICGSAGNRRRWGNFTHIMNPKTLVSPTEIIAVWVVADSAIIADALTTCLFFVPANMLSDKYKFEYFILYRDRSFEKSSKFTGEIFVK